ncbi:MAG: hypothetical protein Q7S43_01310 [bacterium]|nr:hypothetical protein [bacterium]
MQEGKKDTGETAASVFITVAGVTIILLAFIAFMMSMLPPVASLVLTFVALGLIFLGNDLASRNRKLLQTSTEDDG